MGARDETEVCLGPREQIGPYIRISLEEMRSYHGFTSCCHRLHSEWLCVLVCVWRLCTGHVCVC